MFAELAVIEVPSVTICGLNELGEPSEQYTKFFANVIFGKTSNRTKKRIVFTIPRRFDD